MVYLKKHNVGFQHRASPRELHMCDVSLQLRPYLLQQSSTKSDYLVSILSSDSFISSSVLRRLPSYSRLTASASRDRDHQLWANHIRLSSNLWPWFVISLLVPWRLQKLGSPRFNLVTWKKTTWTVEWVSSNLHLQKAHYMLQLKLFHVESVYRFIARHFNCGTQDNSNTGGVTSLSFIPFSLGKMIKGGLQM